MRNDNQTLIPFEKDELKILLNSLEIFIARLRRFKEDDLVKETAILGSKIRCSYDKING